MDHKADHVWTSRADHVDHKADRDWTTVLDHVDHANWTTVDQPRKTGSRQTREGVGTVP